jgi:hypothetical protein
VQISTVIMFGVLFGAAAATMTAFVFVATRPYRRTRSFWSIKITQVVAGGSAVVGLLFC